jgi:hypothetical protein
MAKSFKVEEFKHNIQSILRIWLEVQVPRSGAYNGKHRRIRGTTTPKLKRHKVF